MDSLKEKQYTATVLNYTQLLKPENAKYISENAYRDAVVFYWDGAEYSVFGLSIITAAGHEIGKIRISWYLYWLEFQKYQN